MNGAAARDTAGSSVEALAQALAEVTEAVEAAEVARARARLAEAEQSRLQRAASAVESEYRELEDKLEHSPERRGDLQVARPVLADTAELALRLSHEAMGAVAATQQAQRHADAAEGEVAKARERLQALEVEAEERRRLVAAPPRKGRPAEPDYVVEWQLTPADESHDRERDEREALQVCLARLIGTRQSRPRAA